MARKPDVSAYKSFDQIVKRMDEIVDQVRGKDTSLERSLDLFDEAIALGTGAPGFAMVGDCLAVGDIMTANQKAFSRALDIGKIVW